MKVTLELDASVLPGMTEDQAEETLTQWVTEGRIIAVVLKSAGEQVAFAGGLRSAEMSQKRAV